MVNSYTGVNALFPPHIWACLSDPQTTVWPIRPITVNLFIPNSIKIFILLVLMYIRFFQGIKKLI